MKYILIILIAALCYGNSFAGSKKPEEIAKQLNNVSEQLKDLTRSVMNENELLERQLNRAKEDSTLLTNIINQITNSSANESTVRNPKNLFANYIELRSSNNQDSSSNNQDKCQEIRKELESMCDSKDAEAAELYLLEIDMCESLCVIYNEEINDSLIERIKHVQQDSNFYKNLPAKDKDKDEFEWLAKLVNNYRFYTFELARLYEVADSKRTIRDSNKFAKEEEAEYLLSVPYTKRALTEYINENGKRKKLKEDLTEACPDAFSD